MIHFQTSVLRNALSKVCISLEQYLLFHTFLKQHLFFDGTKYFYCFVNIYQVVYYWQSLVIPAKVSQFGIFVKKKCITHL